MNKQLSIIIATVLSLGAAWAEAPRFDRVFGSHMVLPHGKNIPIAGTADPNKEVAVTFGSATLKAKTDSRGRWTTTLPPQKPNATGQTLTAAQNGEETKLEDVLVGEVWLASGQSNMLFRLNQSSTGGQDIPQAADPELRILNHVPQAHTNGTAYTDKDFDALTPEKFYAGSWAVSSPATAAPTSAVAYYFAKNLREGLKMPVGIIHTSLGGSEMAAWLPQAVIDSNSKLHTLRGNNWLDSPLIAPWARGRAKQNISPRLSKGTPQHPYKPAFLYETGIAWMTGFPINGVIWYQGETDAEIINNETNAMQLDLLINSWRKAFGNAALPFLMVQLPHINDSSKLRAGWPEFREMQDYVAKNLPGVYCINTIDLGASNSNVHPSDKKPVGERLANTALNKVYGQKIACDFPTLKAFKAQGNKILIQIANGKGLTTKDGQPPTHFEIAGTDGVYHQAEASIVSDKDNAVIQLISPDVKTPKHARYCWTPFATPNLVNGNGLPAKPFRTDSPMKPVKR